MFKGRNYSIREICSGTADHELARNAYNSCSNIVLLLRGNFNVLASCSKVACLRTQKKGVLKSNFKSRGIDEKISVGDRSFAHFIEPLRKAALVIKARPLQYQPCCQVRYSSDYQLLIILFLFIHLATNWLQWKCPVQYLTTDIDVEK